MSNIVKADSLWTCDRCNTQIVWSCQGRPEDPPLPPGWRWVGLDSDEGRGEDWCDSCAAAYDEWHAKGRKK